MQFKRLIVLFLVFVLFSSSISALDWNFAKSFIKPLLLKTDFGTKNVRFAYYESESNLTDTIFAYATCRSDRSCFITFFEESFNLDKSEFRCIAYHEVKHCLDCRKGIELTEKSANNFMQLKDSSCVKRYSE